MKTIFAISLALLTVSQSHGGEILLSDDFTTPSLKAWQVLDIGKHAAPSRWSISQGALHQTSNIYERARTSDQRADWRGSFLIRRNCQFDNGDIEMAFWSTDDDGVGLAWHIRDKDNLCKVQLDASPPCWQVSTTVGGKYKCLGVGPIGYRKGQLHRLRVRCDAKNAVVWLDGKLLFADSTGGPETGSVAIESRGNEGTHADYIRVRSCPSWKQQELQQLQTQSALPLAELEHLCVLPGEALRLRLTAGVNAIATVHVANKELARIPLSAANPILWRNPGGMNELGEVRLHSDGKVVRTLPFNIWQEWPKGIGVCAHRGDNRVAPENTLPAIRLAVQKKAHQIEIDVTRSKDGHLVLLHDLTLDRTTDGTGRPSLYTLAELKKLDAGSWKGKKWKGTRIPTLEEALAEIPNGIWANLHLKAGVGADTARLLTRLQRTRWCFLACSRGEAAKAHAVNPKLLICNMSGQSGPDSPYPQQTIAMKANFLQLLGFSPNLPRVSRELEHHGIRRNFFPANNPAFFRRLLEGGVQYPLTDNLDAMLKVLADLGIPEPTLEP